MSETVRVLHLISNLDVGGAEMMLSKLVSGMDRARFHNVVYSMIDPGPIGDAIRAKGIEVHSLGMKRGVPDPLSLIKLARALRKWRPAVVQTWMYHSDLLGGIAGLVSGRIPVVWNIRHSDLRPGADSALTIRVAGICAALSSLLPARIVCCAESSRLIHTRLGYRSLKMVVIPNGFDLEKYRPQADATVRCDEQFGIPADSEVVALIARYHPQKDHTTFMAAAKLFLSEFPNSRFVLCGDGIDEGNAELMSLIDKNGLRQNVTLLGRRKPEEIALIMSRSIPTSSSSRGEAFPNVVGEAMACGSVCVVTDVGDSACIVGDCGIVVPSGSPRELAAGWTKVMAMSKVERIDAGMAARRRVEENFTIGAIVTRYQDLYLEVAQESR